MLLLVVFAAAAQELGLEVILGAFVAGALLGVLDRDRAMSHRLLQATSLPFIVAATAIGAELGVLGPDTAAGLVAAGLLSLLLFPAGALTLLRRGARSVPS
jgi:hypothetical protein